LLTGTPRRTMHAATRPQYKVAAPYALPAGMSVQIIDCAGVKLSMVNSSNISAFRIFAGRGVGLQERMGGVQERREGGYK